VIGMQSVGMLLVVAMLIIPPSSARFWTNRIGVMTILSGLLGGLSAFLGVLVSSLYSNMSAGAVIVLCGTIIFVLSLLLGARRGVLKRVILRIQLNRKVGQQDLLRAFYEIIEEQLPAQDRQQRQRYLKFNVTVDDLCQKRSWSQAHVKQLLKKEMAEGYLTTTDQKQYQLTENGLEKACVIVRNHRMWEIYLIQYADVATSQVDRVADRIEHVLEPDVIAELEQTMATESSFPVIASPH